MVIPYQTAKLKFDFFNGYLGPNCLICLPPTFPAIQYWTRYKKLIILQFRLACECIHSCQTDTDGFAGNPTQSDESLEVQQQFLHIHV